MKTDTRRKCRLMTTEAEIRIRRHAKDRQQTPEAIIRRGTEGFFPTGFRENLALPTLTP